MRVRFYIQCILRENEDKDASKECFVAYILQIGASNHTLRNVVGRMHLSFPGVGERMLMGLMPKIYTDFLSHVS